MNTQVEVPVHPILFLAEDGVDSIEVHNLEGICNCKYCKNQIRLIVIEQ
jgi:hypothetical protein